MVTGQWHSVPLEFESCMYSNLGQQLKFSAVHTFVIEQGGFQRNKKDLKMDTWGIYRGGKDEGSPIYHYDVYKCSHNGSFTACCASQWQSRAHKHPGMLNIKDHHLFYAICLRAGHICTRQIFVTSY